MTLIYVTAFYYALATFCSVGYGGLVFSRNELELRCATTRLTTSVTCART